MFEKDEIKFAELIIKIIHSLYYSKSKIIIPSNHKITSEYKTYWNNLKPSTNFQNKEIEEGKKLLKKMNINDNDKYVLIGLREQHYYDNFVDKIKV